MDREYTRRTSLRGALGMTLPLVTGPASASSPLGTPPGAVGPMSVRAAGAMGDGSVDDTAAFARALQGDGVAYVPPGRYRLGAVAASEFQRPLHLRGEGAASVIVLEQQQRPAFRVAAVGGEFGDVRAQTVIEMLTFRRRDTARPPYAYTAIDLQATHPYAVRDLVMLDLGPDALRMTSCYYGNVHGISLANSGVTMEDVNNCTFGGSDIRPDEFTDKELGATLFGKAGRYPISLTTSDKVTFAGTVIEGWKCPVMLLRRSSNTVLDSCWLEGLISPTHVIRCDDAGSLEFRNSWIDLSIPYRGCFIEVGAGQEQGRVTQVRIDGGTLTAASRSFGDAGKFVAAPHGEQVRVLIDGATLRGGTLYGDRTVEFDIRSIVLSGSLRHFFYSVPNARMERERNSWVPRSSNRDWDFATTSFATDAPELRIGRSTAPGTFLTGSAGIRVSGFAPGRRRTLRRATAGMMGPATREGQSYLVFVRLRCNRDAVVRIEINGGYLDFAATPDIPLRGGDWYDIVLKTQEDVTWAQGRFSSPDILIQLENQDGSPAALDIDRLDHMICSGDVSI